MMNFKKIYSAANSTEAHLIRGLFEQRSIRSILFGEDLTIAAGGLPIDVYQIDILVDEKMYTEALEIISAYEEILRKPVQNGESWECEECNNVNPYTFEICWNCQAIHSTVA